MMSGMLHAMLLKTYADIAKELGVAPGGEFRRAYHEVGVHRNDEVYLYFLFQRLLLLQDDISILPYIK